MAALREAKGIQPNQMGPTEIGTPPRRRIPRWPFWVGGSILALLVTIVVLIDIAAHRAEPFVRQQLVQALSDRFHARVELDSFHLSLGNTLHGEWGVWGEGKGLRIWPPADVEGVHVPEPNPPLKPLIQLSEFHFHAPLRYKSGEPVHITQIRLNGLDIRFPPRSHMQRASEPKSTTIPPSAPFSVAVVVDAVDCTDARLTLETDKPNKLPLEFVISSFRLKGVHPGTPVMFDAQLQNPKPPGLIHTSGSFGPWIVADPGEQPHQRRLHLQSRRPLGLQRHRRDVGLDRQVRRHTARHDSRWPDRHSRLSAIALRPHHDAAHHFHARVDGTNGDTWLDPVDATLNSSHFTARGQIVRVLKTGDDGRLHSIGHDIALTVNVGRASDRRFPAPCNRLSRPSHGWGHRGECATPYSAWACSCEPAHRHQRKICSRSSGVFKPARFRSAFAN